MQIRRISFQADKRSPLRFSDDYEEFCKSDTDWQEYIESPQINQMQLELLRRMRAMEGHESSAEPLTHERERKLSRGREEFMRRTKLMLTFLRKLEDEYSGPPYWACTSHYSVSFWQRDYSSYSDTPDDGRDVKLSIALRSVDSDGIEIQLTTGSGNALLCTTDPTQALEKSASILGAVHKA